MKLDTDSEKPRKTWIKWWVIVILVAAALVLLDIGFGRLLAVISPAR